MCLKMLNLADYNMFKSLPFFFFEDLTFRVFEAFTCVLLKQSAFISGLQLRVGKKKSSYFSTKTYVVGTQKNRLNEMVLLSTQNIF